MRLSFGLTYLVPRPHGPRCSVLHVAHLFHHRAHGHRVLPGLHVLHHVAHHVLLHLHHAIPHRPVRGHHVGDDSGGRGRLLHARCGVHRGDEIIEPLIGGFHVGHHFLLLGHHRLALGLHAGRRVHLVHRRVLW